jgi:hypothetical protein
LSNVSAANPDAKAPVTFDTEFKAPPIECVMRDVVPYAKPIPNSKGP